MLLLELDKNPRRRALSFLTGLVLNTTLVGALLELRSASVEPYRNAKPAKLVYITPARPSSAAVALGVPLKSLRLLSLPAPQPPLIHRAAAPELPPLLRTESTIDPPPGISAPPAPPAIVNNSFQAAGTPLSVRPGIPARAPAQIGSFGSSVLPSATSHRNAVVAAGFGSTAAGVRSESAAVIRSAGFDAPGLASPKARATPVTTGGWFQSAEILTKPKPIYTEEARRMRVEGEVWLEVLFGADGTPRVQRVLRSLGYGLDENAIQSAAQIRFRPAREGSHEVDQVATVRVQFQLAE